MVDDDNEGFTNEEIDLMEKTFKKLLTVMNASVKAESTRGENQCPATIQALANLVALAMAMQPDTADAMHRFFELVEDCIDAQAPDDEDDERKVVN